MTLRAYALNCTLKPSPSVSSTDVIISQVADELRKHDVKTETTRAVDRDIRPGVTSDEGDGDEWPSLREDILASDLLLLATPIWLGHPSSVAQRVLERLDAFLGETDHQGRMISSGRVAWAVAVLVIVLSIVVHGVSTTPALRYIDRRRELRDT